MNSKVTGVVIVVIILAGCAYALRARLNPSDSPSYKPPVVEAPGQGVVGTKGDTDPFDVKIVYSPEGYSPATVTVKKGTRVRFENASKEPTWPASGIHPTHTLYPEKETTDCLGSSFDACASLEEGEFFDYTFNYVGEWPFHDHLHGYNTGKIIVTAE